MSAERREVKFTITLRGPEEQVNWSDNRANDAIWQWFLEHGDALNTMLDEHGFYTDDESRRDDGFDIVLIDRQDDSGGRDPLSIFKGSR